MFVVNTLHRKSDNNFYAKDIESGEEIVVDNLFPIEKWDCPEAFNMAGIKGYEPMTAKELDTEEKQDSALSDSNNILEEKFDGTRALLYFLSQTDSEGEDIGFCRVFSRRISKKTDFYVENTDSLPHLRELDIPELAGTILDGEMFINGLPFKEVSSTLNCLWDKAVDRQIEKGFITLHAFDILFYKGIDLRNMPLHRRKEYLHLAVEEAGSDYIEEVKYYECGSRLNLDVNVEINVRFGGSKTNKFLDYLENNEGTYPTLYSDVLNNKLTPKGYYELIVASGGEGLIIKPKNGKYLHKRGWEYSKIKKFLTRELIVIGFDEPTREYTGKDIHKWGYWVDSQNKRVQGNFMGDKNYTPVTKFYYYNQVGNLLLGVLISKEDFEKISKNKRGETYEPSDCNLDPRFDEDNLVMQVCECAGFDDETRDYFTKKREKLVGSVVEVKANELFKDTGKMRHPRYLRQRFDKDAEQCIWEDHIGDSVI